ncbi:CvpA family protein [Glaciecola sp. XM2]|jgi:membrane protein required for colicin V production|uniref:CvpA family protein n=1 Tax=Glaciecola sp. XM2 TaxID=1914931 RepID=UPI001BDE9337|nr:CvpA family protein [Glaciecola sp. XM2]MBT1452087.1 CvpA family protein [Glaciecola sp. XM2]
MNWFDFTIIGIIAFSAIISVVRGFMKEAVSLVVWIAAFFVASQFYLNLAQYLTQIDDTLIRNGVAIAILFIGTLITGALINYVFSQLVKATGLSGTDRVLGAVFGALRGVLVVSAALFFLDTFTPAASSIWWTQSILVPEFAFIIEWFFEYVKEGSSFLSDTV